MWKITGVVLLIIFLVADSIYLYLRLKKYWRNASRNKPGEHDKKWKLGLSSLDMPLGRQPDKNLHKPVKP